MILFTHKTPLPAMLFSSSSSFNSILLLHSRLSPQPFCLLTKHPFSLFYPSSISVVAVYRRLLWGPHEQLLLHTLWRKKKKTPKQKKRKRKDARWCIYGRANVDNLAIMKSSGFDGCALLSESRGTVLPSVALYSLYSRTLSSFLQRDVA